jgi:hypothetical protein
VTKRQCEATTARGEPCKARPLRDSAFCLLHSPDSSPAELGRKGGKGRGRKTEEPELPDRDQAMAALRKSLSSGNSAAVVAAAKALIDLAPVDQQGWSSDATLHQAREKLDARIEAIAARQAVGLARAGRCPTCERALSPSEAESLMAKGANESVVGWMARVTTPPPDQGVQPDHSSQTRTTLNERLGP